MIEDAKFEDPRTEEWTSLTWTWCVVMDGPVDASWIENLSTVLNDMVSVAEITSACFEPANMLCKVDHLR